MGMSTDALFPIMVERFFVNESKDRFFRELVYNASDALNKVLL